MITLPTVQLLSETSVNSDPIPGVDNVSVFIDEQITFNVLDNDFDPDGDPLVASNFLPGGFYRDPSGERPNPFEPLGTFDFGPVNGQVTYTPGDAFNDQSPAGYRQEYIEYMVSDGNGGIAQSAVYITVLPCEDPSCDNLLIGSFKDDSLRSGDGNDVVRGASGNDDIRGGNGNDVVSGGSGDDDVRGGFGNDSIKGGEGNDTLDGGRDDDQLTGGRGDDVFVFNGVWGADAGDDTIYDYNDGSDTLRVLNVQEITVRDGSAGAVLEMSSGGSLTLLGVSASDIDESDFQQFVPQLVYELDVL